MLRIFLLTMLVAALMGLVIAQYKNRSWPMWAALCAIFPLLIVVLLLLPPSEKTGPGGAYKKCPYCAETIKREATVCKHCGRDIPIEMSKCPDCGTYVPQGAQCPTCKK